MVPQRQLILTVACIFVAVCAVGASGRYRTAPIVEPERGEIMKAVYRYVSEHHTSQTITDMDRRKDGIVEVSMTNRLEIYFLQKVNGSWKVIKTLPGMSY
jgi:hypothetical protein